MFQKICWFLLVLIFIFISVGCNLTDLSNELKEYAFHVLAVCSVLPFSTQPGISYIIIEDTTTWTYTNVNYDNQNDLDAIVNGTIIVTDDNITKTSELDLIFTNDDMGLETLGGNYSGPSNGKITTGTIIINGYSVAATEYQNYWDNL